MTYLLIVFILLVAAAPLVWVKSSARQDKIALLRQAARSRGVDVTLCRAPDAREDEGMLDHTQYRLPWSLSEGEKAVGNFLLVRRTRRGDPTPWGEWRWLERPATKNRGFAMDESVLQEPFLQEIVSALSEDVNGLEVTPRGLSFYWQEKDSMAALQANLDLLESMRDRFLNSKKQNFT